MPISFDELRQQITSNAVTYLRLRSLLAEPDRTDENMATVMACIAKNTSVEYLNFDGISLTPDHVTALAELLEHNTTLKRLNLADQHINSEGIQRLTAALAVNTGLEGLYLVHTSLDDVGIQALADALVRNQHLAELNINSCAFTPRGVEAFCDTLAGNNHTLQELYLVGPFDIPALKALTELLKTSGIKSLYIGNPLDYREPGRLEPLCELIRTAPLNRLILTATGILDLRNWFLMALMENTTLTAVEISCCVNPKFEWYLRNRNNEIAKHPEQREDICKKYRPELEKFLIKSPVTAPHDNPASHWHHPNNVSVNATKEAEGNENHDHDVTSPVSAL